MTRTRGHSSSLRVPIADLTISSSQATPSPGNRPGEVAFVRLLSAPDRSSINGFSLQPTRAISRPRRRSDATYRLLRPAAQCRRGLWHLNDFFGAHFPRSRAKRVSPSFSSAVHLYISAPGHTFATPRGTRTVEYLPDDDRVYRVRGLQIFGREMSKNSFANRREM